MLVPSVSPPESLSPTEASAVDEESSVNVSTHEGSLQLPVTVIYLGHL